MCSNNSNAVLSIAMAMINNYYDRVKKMSDDEMAMALMSWD